MLVALLCLFWGSCVSTDRAVENPPPATETVASAPAEATADQAGPEVPPVAPPLVTPEVIENPEVTLLDSEGAGKLYNAGGHLVCVMEGTPEEMGFQHGRLLAERARHILKEGYVDKALWQRGYTPEYVNAQADRMAKHFSPAHVAEMEGIVKGLHAAGVSEATYEDVRLGVVQAEILHYGPDAPPGCSNFACWGRWTPDGRLLHGRNLDWTILGGAQDDAVILVWRPKGGVPFMMMGWACAIGSVTGMNAQGITIGEMTCSSPDSTFDGLPLFLIMRRVLEESASLDAAVAIMEEGPRTTGWNFVIGDGKIPDARALEVDAKRCDAFAPLDLKETEATGHWAMADAVRRTNHPIGAERLQMLIDEHAPKMNLEIKTIAEGIPFLQKQNSWQRYDFMGKQIMANEGALGITESLQILATRPVGNSATLHSCVMDPTHRVAYVSVAGSNPPVTASRRPYVRIDFTPWFL